MLLGGTPLEVANGSAGEAVVNPDGIGGLLARVRHALMSHRTPTFIRARSLTTRCSAVLESTVTRGVRTVRGASAAWRRPPSDGRTPTTVFVRTVP